MSTTPQLKLAMDLNNVQYTLEPLPSGTEYVYCECPMILGKGISQTKTQYTSKTIIPLEANKFLPINDVDFTKVEIIKDAANSGEIMMQHAYLGYIRRIRGNNAALNSEIVDTLISNPSYHAFTQREMDLALTQALSRVDASVMEGGVSLAEARETLMFIRRPLASLDTVFKRLKRRTLSNFERGVRKEKATYDIPKYRAGVYAEALTDSWLAYRYAVRPLMFDVASAAEASVHHIKGWQKMYSARGSYTSDWTVIRDGEIRSGLYGCQNYGYRAERCYHAEKLTEQHKCSYIVRWKPRLFMSDALTLAKWGLSPTQLGRIIWEATPFSFVADWMWSFGDWIKAMEPKPHLEVVDVCRTNKWTHLIQATHQQNRWVYRSTNFQISGRDPRFDFDCKIEKMSRRQIPYGSLIAPTPRIKKNGMHFLRVLDSVSLSLKPILGVIRHASKKL